MHVLAEKTQSAIGIWQSAINVGAEGEVRTLEASLEDLHVASYITPAGIFPIAEWQLPSSVLMLLVVRLVLFGTRYFGVRNNRQLAIANRNLLELPAGLEPAASTFEASRSSI